MRRLLLITAVLASAACDAGIDVLNVAPEVTAVGPVFQDGDAVSIFFWVRDHEESSVDVTVELIRGGNAEVLDGLGGNGTVGLTTNREPTGNLQRLLWTPADDIAADESLQLKLTVADDEGAQGIFETESFTLTAGLPSP